MFVIGYFTENTPYEAIGADFSAHLTSRGIDHDIRGVPNLGSWLKNTSYKSKFVRDMLREVPGRPVVYLDVDAEIIEPPVLLDNLDCDIAASIFATWELLSGTVYFNPTPKTLECVDRWVELCEQWPDRIPPGVMGQYPNGEAAWDQRLLSLAIHRTPGIRFTELPPAYTYIHDLTRDHYPDAKPVIMHHAASRKYRDKITA